MGDKGTFRLELDEAATQHQISRNALGNIIIGELEGARQHVGAASNFDAFVRLASGVYADDVNWGLAFYNLSTWSPRGGSFE